MAKHERLIYVVGLDLTDALSEGRIFGEPIDAEEYAEATVQEVFVVVVSLDADSTASYS